jgi:phosphohistidine swiveling domain-containing protein
MLENTLESIAQHIQCLVEKADFQAMHKAILQIRSLGKALMGDMEERLIFNPAYKPRVPVSEVLLVPDNLLIKILSHEESHEMTLSRRLLGLFYIRKGRSLVAETPVSAPRNAQTYAEMQQIAVVHKRLVEANFAALELMSRSKDHLNREIIKLILDNVQEMITAWGDISSHVSDFDPQQGLKLLTDKLALYRKTLLGYTEPQLQSKEVENEIYSMLPFRDFYEINSLSQFINFIHQNSFEQLRKSLDQIHQSPTIVRVFGKKLSIINLNEEEIIVDGKIRSLFLKIFLDAFDEQQAREVETKLIIYDDYLIADTALGLHTANIQARLAAPDEGGMVRVRYQEDFITAGRSWRLLFLTKVLEAYGAHVEIVGKTLLKMRLDKDFGATDLIAIRAKFIKILNLLFYARDLDLHLKSEKHALALAQSFLHHATIRGLERLGVNHIQRPKRISASRCNRLNQRLKELGIPAIPQDMLMTQSNIEQFVNEQIGRRLRRGELIWSGRGNSLLRNRDYHPMQDLLADIDDAEKGKWLIRNAELILARAALIRFNTIGAIGRYLLQVGTFKTRSMTQMVAIILRDPDRQAIVLARIVKSDMVSKPVGPDCVKEIVEDLVRYQINPQGDLEDYESRLINYRRRIKRPWSDATTPGIVVARGTAVSAGMVKGTITMRKQLATESGKILLTPYTEPKDTPLIGSFAAIVTTTGGRLSHTAIVAREMGIPSVALTQAQWILGDDDDPVCRIRLYFPKDFSTTPRGYQISTTITERVSYLREGARVIVNGGSGEVLLEEVSGALPKVENLGGPYSSKKYRSDNNLPSALLRPSPGSPRKGLISPLMELSQNDVLIAGSKATSLGELTKIAHRIGFNVPSGFVVTTTAFQRFISETGIDSALQQILARKDKPLDWISKKMTALFLDACGGNLPFVSELRNAIEERAKSIQGALNDTPLWAVRSSSILEDSVNVSFAGQGDTYLGVTAKKLFENVVHNMISLATPRALTYRAQFDVGAGLPMHAVLVQQMVNADLSGIIFTSNPLHQGHDRIVITAARGLGEGVVSGIVPADEYIVDKTTMDEAQEPMLGRQNIKVVMGESGGTKIVPMPHRNTQPVLYHSDIYRLAQIAMAIESYFHEPRDIEWGIKISSRGEREIYLFQARPITTRVKCADEIGCTKCAK